MKTLAQFSIVLNTEPCVNNEFNSISFIRICTTQKVTFYKHTYFKKCLMKV
jgi:hypothetical protein